MRTQCSLFQSPCYGEHCNFHNEFIKLAQYERQLLQLKAENKQLTQELEKARDALKHIAKPELISIDELIKENNKYYDKIQNIEKVLKELIKILRA